MTMFSQDYYCGCCRKDATPLLVLEISAFLFLAHAQNTKNLTYRVTSEARDCVNKYGKDYPPVGTEIA